MKAVEPVYPEEARDAWIQGIVVLKLEVDRDGRVGDVRVVRSIPLLDDAAVGAVRQWRYEPTLRDGEAVPVAITVPVRFVLPGADDWIVAPPEKAVLKLNDYFLHVARDGSRVYRGTIENVSETPVAEVAAALSFVERPASGEGGGEASGSPGRTEAFVKSHHVQPEYPLVARAKGIQGVVILELLVDEEGNVGEAVALRSIPALDEAAVSAAKQWRYQPFVRNGVATAFVLTVYFDFQGGKVEISESALSSDARGSISARIGSLEPNESQSFEVRLPVSKGRYSDVRLEFVMERDGRSEVVPTSRQKRSLPPE